MAEVDDLGTLGVHGEGRNTQINASSLHSGDDAVEVHVRNLQGHADLIGNLLRQPNVAANGVGIIIKELIGAVGGLGADDQLALRLNRIQRALCGSDRTQHHAQRQNHRKYLFHLDCLP